MTTEYDVFISYNRRDIELASDLEQALQGRRVYLDTTSNKAGEVWYSRVVDCVHASRLVVVLFSPEYWASSTCRAELRHAISRDPAGDLNVVLPAVLRNAEVPRIMLLLHHLLIEEAEHLSRSVATLHAAIEEALGRSDRLELNSRTRKLVGTYLVELRPDADLVERDEAAKAMEARFTGADTTSFENTMSFRDREMYLKELAQVVTERLEDQTLLPVIGRRAELLPTAGLLSREGERASLVGPQFGDPNRSFATTLVGAYEHSRGRLCITGAAGSGKTTALMVLAIELSRRGKQDDSMPIPVLVSAATWQSSASGDAATLLAWLRTQVPRLAPVLNDLLRKGQIVLLVDGLDELPIDARIENDDGLGTIHPRAEFLQALALQEKFVITSRGPAYNGSSQELQVNAVYALQPLNDRDIDLFVRDLPRVAEVLAEDHELREALRSPLMLTFFAAGIDSTSRSEVGHLTPGEARDMIYSGHVQTMYDRAQRRSKSTALEVPLERLYQLLGFVAMDDAGGGGNRNVFDKIYVRRALETDAVFNLATDMKLLVPAPRDTLRFTHITLRDHFALHHALTALKSPNDNDRDQAAWALWQIPDPRAIGLLIDTLNDPYPYARGSAASALGRIGSATALPALELLLADHTKVASMYGNSIAEVATWAIQEIRSANET